MERHNGSIPLFTGLVACYFHEVGYSETPPVATSHLESSIAESKTRSTLDWTPEIIGASIERSLNSVTTDSGYVADFSASVEPSGSEGWES